MSDTTATAPDVRSTSSTPWYKKPSTIITILVVVALFYVLFQLGTRPLRFDTDVNPNGNVTWDWAFVLSLVPDMLNALSVTAMATVFGFLVAIVLGFFLALGRRSTHRILSWPFAAFIEFVRSTPLLVQLFFLFFALPDLGVVLSPLKALIFGLGVHYGTYTSEAYRAGINSVPAGQWEASTALNLGPRTKWQRVILPQAVPNVLPALGNFLVAAFKDAPLGFAIQVPGLMFFASTIRGRFFRPVESFMMIGVGFLLVSLPAAWLVRRLEKRIAYERIS